MKLPFSALLPDLIFLVGLGASKSSSSREMIFEGDLGKLGDLRGELTCGDSAEILLKVVRLVDIFGLLINVHKELEKKLIKIIIILDWNFEVYEDCRQVVISIKVSYLIKNF